MRRLNVVVPLLTLGVLLCCGMYARGDQPVVPYRMDHDAPLKPTEEAVAEADDHRQLRVEFNGINGDRVPAFLYLPKATAGPHPAVLLQYGTGGNKKTDYIVQIGQQFVASGFAVLTIDAPLRGERRPPGKKDSLLDQLNPSRFAHYCGDYSRAVDYLISRADVDRQRVGYVGISWGAVTGVTYVAHDPRVRAMAAICGGGNFAGILSGHKSDDHGKSRPSLDPVDHVGLIAPRPLKLINVTRDLLVARPFAESLHKAAGENSKVVWFETDHYFTGTDRTKIVRDEVIEFLRQTMPPAAMPNDVAMPPAAKRNVVAEPD